MTPLQFLVVFVFGFGWGALVCRFWTRTERATVRREIQRAAELHAEARIMLEEDQRLVLGHVSAMRERPRA